MKKLAKTLQDIINETWDVHNSMQDCAKVCARSRIEQDIQNTRMMTIN